MPVPSPPASVDKGLGSSAADGLVWEIGSPRVERPVLRERSVGRVLSPCQPEFDTRETVATSGRSAV